MIQLVSATPIEHELYYSDPVLRGLCDSVGQMIMDLHDEPMSLDIILSMNDVECPDEFTLAFSGTTLALDFYPERIEVTDFDLADGNSQEVLETFPRENINQATLWLVNKINDIQ